MTRLTFSPHAAPRPLGRPAPFAPVAKACLLAITASFALAASGAFAKPIVLSDDQAQLKIDRAALTREIAKLDTDVKTLGADARAGRMAAESPDAERMYHIGRAIKAQREDIAADKPASLQMKSDRAALRREESQLKADRKTLAADTESGNMAALSTDADRVFHDRQFIRAELKQCSADQARLKADRNS